MQRFFSRDLLLSDNGCLAGVASSKLLLHFATNTSILGYGFFADEFYYWACAMRLDWGYVDHPPLAPFLLSLNRLLLGDSMFAMRVLPAIAGAVAVYLTGLMVRELGGGKAAQILAASAVALAPVHLALDSFFSPNAFEVLWWTLGSYLLILVLKSNTTKLWIWIGVVAGIGLENKHTMLLFGAALAVGLLLTPSRKHFRCRSLWLGGLIALALFLPNMIWEMQHGWPTLEFYANAESYKNAPTPPVMVILYQVLAMNPVAFPIWLGGLYLLLVSEDGKPYRALGWNYVLLLLVLVLAGSSRPDRIAGSYPVLLAAAAVLIERISATRRWHAAVAGVSAAVLMGGLVLLPFSLPVLPPALTVQYLARLGLSIRLEKGVQPPLPPYLGQRLGWEELTATVAGVYDRLPPNDRARASIFTPFYPVAGALEYYGGKYRLPRPISSHNNFYLWGYDEASGQIVIIVGDAGAGWQDLFREVTQVAITPCHYCAGSGLPIYVARGLRAPWPDVWPRLKHFQ